MTDTSVAPRIRRLERAEVYAAECQGSCERPKCDGHMVAYWTDRNAWRCDCPAGTARRVCKHIRAARAQQHEAGVIRLEEARAARIANGTPRPDDIDPFFGLIESEVSR